MVKHETTVQRGNFQSAARRRKRTRRAIKDPTINEDFPPWKTEEGVPTMEGSRRDTRAGQR